MPDTPEKATAEGAMEMAERLFEESQLSGYYMVKAFLDLYDMVTPEHRPELAKILEGIVK